jgi:hypothetical protein
MVKLTLFLAAIICCGCNQETPKIRSGSERLKWEYKTVRLENEIHKNNEEIYGAANEPEFLRKIQVNEQSPGSFNLAVLDSIGEEGWELISSYIEQETIWPNIKTEIVQGSKPKVIPARDELRQPNFRSGNLVLIFKRAK